MRNSFHEKLDCVTKLPCWKINSEAGFHCMKSYMNSISAKFHQILIGKFKDIVVCLYCPWKATKQALLDCSLKYECSALIRVLRSRDMSKATKTEWISADNFWAFFSACPRTFIYKSLLASYLLMIKILVHSKGIKPGDKAILEKLMQCSATLWLFRTPYYMGILMKFGFDQKIQ